MVLSSNERYIDVVLDFIMNVKSELAIPLSQGWKE